MADQKLTQLTALASLSADDLFYVVDDPAGAALSRKMAASVLDARFATAAQGALAATALQPADIGVIVQAWDDDLDTIAGLAKTDGNFIVGDGAAWTVESGATARASLGLGSLATLSSMTLADVAGYSTTTAHQTFALNAGTDVIFEQADGDDILILYESNQGVQVKAHAAIGGAAGINTSIYDAGSPNEVVLSISESMTDFTNPWYNIGIGVDIELNPSAPSFSYFYAGSVSCRTKNTCTQPFPYIIGLFGAANHFGSGLIDDLVGLEYSVGNYGAGNVTRATGLSIAASNYGSSGTTIATAICIDVWAISKLAGRNITTAIGLNIENQSAATTNFAIRTNAGNIVFNEGSHDDTDFRVEGATDANLFVSDGSADTIQVGAATASDSAKFYVNGKISASGEVEINGALNHDGTELGLFATAPITQQTVTGSRGGNAALASLLTQLAAYGLIVDSSTA